MGPESDHNSVWASHQIRKIAGCAGNVFLATDVKGNRYLAIPACNTARVSRTCCDACWDRYTAEAAKTFPAFPAHTQPAILRIWQEAHADILGRASCSSACIVLTAKLHMSSTKYLWRRWFQVTSLIRWHYTDGPSTYKKIPRHFVCRLTRTVGHG